MPPKAKKQKVAPKKKEAAVARPKDGVYEVEKIIRHKKAALKRGETPRTLYEVQWKYYNDITWEPENNLNGCKDMLLEYKETHKLHTPKKTPTKPKTPQSSRRSRSPTKAKSPATKSRTPSKPKSPAKSKTPTKAKSPRKSRSPSKTKSPSKSPTKRNRSPAKKRSPSKSPKSPKKVSKSPASATKGSASKKTTTKSKATTKRQISASKIKKIVGKDRPDLARSPIHPLPSKISRSPSLKISLPKVSFDTSSPSIVSPSKRVLPKSPAVRHSPPKTSPLRSPVKILKNRKRSLMKIADSPKIGGGRILPSKRRSAAKAPSPKKVATPKQLSPKRLVPSSSPARSPANSSGSEVVKVVMCHVDNGELKGFRVVQKDGWPAELSIQEAKNRCPSLLIDFLLTRAHIGLHVTL